MTYGIARDDKEPWDSVPRPGRMMVGLLRVRVVRLLLLWRDAALRLAQLFCTGPSHRHLQHPHVRTQDRSSPTHGDPSALDADVIAIQEISDVQALRALAAELSAKTSRSYQAVSSDCGGRQRLHLGFLFEKVALLWILSVSFQSCAKTARQLF